MGCMLISTEYKNSKTKLDYVCPNGHKHSVSWDNWCRGRKCPKCSEWGTSNFEKEVKQFIIDQGIEIIENDRTTIKGNKGKYLELDILFSCKTKAIECNGVYWHSLPKAIEKDKLKQDQCKEKGIKLLTITDAMWYNDREECENIIKEFIKKELTNGITD